MSNSRAAALAHELSQVSGKTLAAALDALGHEGRRRLREALTEASERNRDEDRLSAMLRRMDAARAIIDAHEFATLSSRTMTTAFGGYVHWKTAETLAAAMPRTYQIYDDPDSIKLRLIRNIKKTGKQ